MVTAEVVGFQTNYYGNPRDEKPIEGVVNGSTFVEYENGMPLNVYLFDGEADEWVNLTDTSGSRGVY